MATETIIGRRHVGVIIHTDGPRQLCLWEYVAAGTESYIWDTTRQRRVASGMTETELRRELTAGQVADRERRIPARALEIQAAEGIDAVTAVRRAAAEVGGER